MPVVFFYAKFFMFPSIFYSLLSVFSFALFKSPPRVSRKYYHAYGFSFAKSEICSRIFIFLSCLYISPYANSNISLSLIPNKFHRYIDTFVQSVYYTTIYAQFYLQFYLPVLRFCNLNLFPPSTLIFLASLLIYRSCHFANFPCNASLCF